MDQITDVAVIGMAGRFPGANNLADYWRNLRDGVESIHRFTEDELVAAGEERGRLADPNYVRAAGVLSDVENFDAGFFGISPRDAALMDPQHRLFLECAWEALEHAGYNSANEAGAIGVFGGSGMVSYMMHHLAPNRELMSSVGEWLVRHTGNDKDFLSTRVSYELDLKGPSINVQTACSTSLVAIHLACQSLVNGECDLALAGGVNIILPHRRGYLYKAGEILSPDGHCRAFDAKAQGTVFGSGAGIVVLKPRAQAEADGDFIYAVVKGSAVNNDGAQKAGFFAPSVDRQAAVVAEALDIAGVHPETVGYVEAHGTGTAIGDPIEMTALTQAFQRHTAKKGFCAVGSVKTNFGHLGEAAGVAGFIKTVLALHHGELPPSLHFESPNPQIDFANSPFFVPTSARRWTPGRTPRRAGVTALGVGGTNAHVILEEAPPAVGSTTARPSELVVLSAQTETALDAATKNLSAHLEQNPLANLADVAYTLQVGRRAFPCRRVVVCRDSADAAQALQTLEPRRVLTSRVTAEERSVVLMFPGQGAQYGNMGRELYDSEPAFHENIDRLAELFQPWLGCDLRTMLYPESEAISTAGRNLEETSLAQPALFAVEYALARLWMNWGLAHRALIGHSLGEYVAACLAGVFSVENAVRLVAARGRLMQQMPPGVMLTVNLPEAELARFLTEDVSLAAVNAPGLCVLSGLEENIAVVEKELTKDRIAGRRLPTLHAFHSRLLDPMLESFAREFETVELRAPQIPLVSNLTGTWMTPAQACDPQYWVQHARRTVRFADGLRCLLSPDGRAATVSTATNHTARRSRCQTGVRPSTGTETQAVVEDFDLSGASGASDVPAAEDGRTPPKPANALPLAQILTNGSPMRGLENPVLVECGPGAALSVFASRLRERPNDSLVIQSLRQPNETASDRAFLLQSLGRVWLAGVKINWSAVRLRERRLRVPLPTYSFERQRYWIDPPQGGSAQESRALPDSTKRDLADWFCIPSWKQTLPPGDPEIKASHWLVFSDPAGFGERLARRLQGERSESHRASSSSAQTACNDGSMSRLELSTPGDPGNLSWQTAQRSEPRADEVEIEVQAAGLNFRDVLLTLGLYPNPDGRALLGVECAGTVVRVGPEVRGLRVGDKVIAGGPGSLQSFVIRRAGVVVRKPERISWEEAASLPGAFTTAWHALRDVGALRSGERVLIHAGSGGVGLAAIQWSRQIGAEVFATAGSPDKRQFLVNLGIKHVFNSRTLDFADEILKRTDGQGVDVVLNCLTGEFLSRSLAILKPGGRFLELGKREVYAESRLGLVPFRNQFLYAAIDLEELYREHPERFRSILQEVVEEIERGTLRPLPMRIFPGAEAVEAFRLLAQTKHIGKVVLALKAGRPETILVTLGARFQRIDAFHYVINPAQSMEYQALLRELQKDGQLPDRLVHFGTLAADAIPLNETERGVPTRSVPRAAHSPNPSQRQRTAQSAAAGDGRAPESSGVATGPEARGSTRPLPGWAACERGLERGFFSLLWFAQAWEQVSPGRPLQISVVTNRLHQLGGDPAPEPIQSTLLGPCRVLPREHPNLTCRCIDAAWPAPGPGRETQWLDVLVRELSSDSADETVVYRGAQRWVPVFEPVRLNAPPSRLHNLRAGGVYLITGGLGALGMAVAEHLAKTVRARLVLVSRTRLPKSTQWNEWLQTHAVDDPTSQKIRQVRTLLEWGADVFRLGVDVTDLHQMRQAIASVRKRFGAIHGVIHAAGVLQDGIIQLKTKAAAESVLLPKIKGTLVLEEVLREMPLDFFVLFSSISPVLGLPGQVDYAAANAFLDAFAHRKSNEAGGRIVAIDWGPWKEIGLAREAAQRPPVPSSPAESGPEQPTNHPLLDRCLRRNDKGALYSTGVSWGRHWVLDEHRLSNGEALWPGTGFLELARAAFEDFSGEPAAELEDVSFVSPLLVSAGESKQLFVQLRKDGAGFSFAISGSLTPRADAELEHAHVLGKIQCLKRERPGPLGDREILQRCPTEMDIASPTLTPEFFRLGPRWANLQSVRGGAQELFTRLALPPEFQDDLPRLALHPALLDRATGSAQLLFTPAQLETGLYVPFAYERLRIWQPLPARCSSLVRRAGLGLNKGPLATFDVTLIDEAGQVLVEIAGFTMKQIDPAMLTQVAAKPAVSTACAKKHRIEFSVNEPDPNSKASSPPSERSADSPVPECRPQGSRGQSGPRSALAPEVGSHESAAPEASNRRLGSWVEKGIPTPAGLAAFDRILAAAGPPQIVVTAQDLHELIAQARRRAVEATPHDEARAESSAPQFARPHLATAYVAPRQELEQRMAQLWQDLLGIQQVGIHDDFFELGGHSLLATQLHFRLRDAFKVDLPLSRMFETPTVAGLAEVIARHKESGSKEQLNLPPVVLAPSERHEPFALTDVQEAYWIGRGDTIELGRVSCHSYCEIEMEDVDVRRFERALHKLIARHEMLRSVIRPDGCQQILKEAPPYRIEVQNLPALDPAAQAAHLRKIRGEMSHRVHPSDRWPLFEFRFTQLSERTSLLHSSIDLLIADARSFEVLFRELTRFYRDPEIVLEPLDLSFRDYHRAAKQLEDAAAFSRSKEYWLERLPNLPPAPELPVRVSPASIIRPEFVRREMRLPAETWSRLKTQAARLDLTPSGLLLAAFAEVLAVWSKKPRFTINLTLFNRLPLHPQVNDLVGDFTSVTLLEVDRPAGGSFETQARRLQQQLWRDLDHRYFSGIRVLREWARARKEEPRALMPVVFTSILNMNDADDPVRWSSRLGKLAYAISQTPQVYLDCQVYEERGELAVDWDAVDELFPEGVLDDMLAGYIGLLHRLAVAEAEWQKSWPQIARALIPETHLIARNAANATQVSLTSDLLHTLFAAQVPQRRTQAAIITPNRTLSYEELHRRAGHLALELRALGVQPNTLVAVVMEKGWEQVVAVLAIQFAGAAYLPIDPDLPAERIQFLLEHGQCRAALTQSWLADQCPWPERISRFNVDALAPAKTETPSLETVQRPEDLAYVIYTSGSTGTPKGVMIDHRGAVNTILDLNERFGIGPNDRVLALSALSFDLSVYDIFGTLAAGGTIVMPEATLAKNPAHWASLIVGEQVTVWNSVPALLGLLVDHANGYAEVLGSSLRLVLLSGDWIPIELPDRFRRLVQGARVVSLGGATEASIWSICYPIEKVDLSWRSIPYGRPLRNQSFHVLNEALEPCPVGVPGQLCIGGVGLAQGYWRDDDKTQAHFIRHPRTGERFYCTGDLGRYLEDGNIEFLGREDFQVKIHGFRVELGEIEAALAKHPDVAAAVVTADGDARGARRLIAHVVPNARETSRNGERADDANLGEKLRAAGRKAARQLPPKLDAAATNFERLERLGTEYLGRALHDLGAFVQPLEKHSLDSLIKNCGIQPRLRRLVRQWLETLWSDGQLRREGEDTFVNVQPVANGSVDALLEEARRNQTDWDKPLLDYIQRSGERLVDLLQGRLDPLELLFPGGARKTAQEFYQDNSLARYFNGILRELIKARVAAWPGTKPIRLLEIGAGIGGTTACLLPALPADRTRYTFTDLSIFFTNQARDEFQDFPFVEYRQLNIERDPAAQGFSLASYDLVIAANVLHGTRDLQESLGHVRSLLAPGGWVLLFEATRNIRAHLVTVGFIEGFTRFEDDRGSQQMPLLEVSQWEKRLRDCGFDSGLAFPEPQSAAEVLGHHVIVAQVAAESSCHVSAPCAGVSGSLESRWRSFLRSKLPEYMIPAVFVQIETLPLTPNGNVDRRRLSPPAPVSCEAAQPYVAPRNDLERTLAGLWSSVLRVERIGIHDNFFDLGGDSILNIQIVSKALAAGLPVETRHIFQHQTVAELAAVLGSRQRSAGFQSAVSLDCIRQSLGPPELCRIDLHPADCKSAIRPTASLHHEEGATLCPCPSEAGSRPGPQSNADSFICGQTENVP